MGADDSAADLFPGAAIADPAASESDGRRWVVRSGGWRVAVCRAADRRGRHAVWLDLHAVSHAQSVDRGAVAGVCGIPRDGEPGAGLAHGTLHELEGGDLADLRGVSFHDRAVHLFFGTLDQWHRGGG